MLLADGLDVLRPGALGVLNQVELHPLALRKRLEAAAADRGVMDEDVLAAAVELDVLDEADPVLDANVLRGLGVPVGGGAAAEEATARSDDGLVDHGGRADLGHQVVVPLALDLEVSGGAEFDGLWCSSTRWIDQRLLTLRSAPQPQQRSLATERLHFI